MTEELKFPLEFNTCPSCGGTKRLAETVMQQEKEKGKIGEDVKAAIFSPPPVVIIDPRRMSLSSPVIITRFDICIEEQDDGTLCGTLYCIRADLGTATPGVKPPKMPPGMQGLGLPHGDPRLS